MNLIDADKLCYEDIESIDGNTYMVVHAPQIEDMSKAYDVDKIVKTIESIADNVCNHSRDEISEKEVYDLLYYIRDIVKAGDINKTTQNEFNKEQNEDYDLE